jgi:arylsulfatase A-like enzyme
VTTPANIILITVDCLRADFLGCYGSSIATPHLDRLASEGIRYQYAFSHSSFTKPTFPTIFSSTYPGQHGGSRRFAETRPNIVSILQAHGYQTLGVNSNPWLSPRFGFHRGYTHYHDLSSATPVAHSLPVRLLNNLLGLVGGGLIYPPYPPAQEVTDAALALRKKATSPYFLWLHYMDAHWPYGVDRPHLFGPWDRQKWAYNARFTAAALLPLTVRLDACLA